MKLKPIIIVGLAVVIAGLIVILTALSRQSAATSPLESKATSTPIVDSEEQMVWTRELYKQGAFTVQVPANWDIRGADAGGASGLFFYDHTYDYTNVEDRSSEKLTIINRYQMQWGDSSPVPLSFEKFIQDTLKTGEFEKLEDTVLGGFSAQTIAANGRKYHFIQISSQNYLAIHYLNDDPKAAVIEKIVLSINFKPSAETVAKSKLIP